ncbi:glycoside hydrolase family 5 protein [Dactylosporangium sp. CS-033363]|uniref:glycoside hydrolase family 5 protein n=1 Tax=Dactylosporangium sp. CS-033363 TaxID=3239935 RepID=UPI003D8DD44C
MKPIRVLVAAAMVVSLTPLVEASGTAGASETAGAGEAAWVAPLSTRGRYIVDADGNRFKLKAGNWHGASGTWNGSGDTEADANHHAGENSGRIPLGLDRVSLASIVAQFRALGVNSIRLPFSNEMVHDQRAVTDGAVAANPQLRGMTPLQVYDAVVAALTAGGLAVILNNHTNTTRWCCGVDGNERWNASQSTATWESDWLFMVRRYRDNARVVGADLYNEVRRTVWDDPNWGLGDDHDWFAAAQHLGDRILSEANPDLLVIVEGINWTGIPVDGFAHGRPTLEPLRTLSPTLVRSNKLVLSAHFYDYTGPNHSGATGIGETSDPRYRDLSRADLQATLYRQAFYAADEAAQHFTAPLWVSEFGIGRFGSDDRSRAWFANFVDYLIAHDTDFAYWPLVGWQQDGTGNGWALLSWDRAGNLLGIDDGGDWRAADWHRLVNAPSRTGAVAPVAHWAMLSPDRADFIASLRVRAQPDWDAGARKAACPDGQRLIGIAHDGNRGLCTDTGNGPQWPAGSAQRVVTDERFVSPDWAGGYTKFQCPDGSFLIGYAVRGATMSSALCAPASAAPPSGGRTVWFDRGDNRPSGAHGGDFATGHYKGQCGDGEYAAGIAFTRRIGSNGAPAALYCRSF